MSRTHTPRFTRDEIIDIMRKHVHAYKDDEQFAQAVIDMAAFLVEYRAHKRRTSPAATGDATATGEQRRRWLRDTEDRDEELKRTFQRYQKERPTDCNLCGAPTHGQAMCPHCGNMAL